MSLDPVVVQQEVLDGHDYSARTSRPRRATAVTTPRVIRDSACATMYEPSGNRHR
jgi:hypothetical protein